MVLVFKAINDKLIIDFILKFAGYLRAFAGLIFFWHINERQLNDKLIWQFVSLPH
jgi:hypothetical protein